MVEDDEEYNDDEEQFQSKNKKIKKNVLTTKQTSIKRFVIKVKHFNLNLLFWLILNIVCKKIRFIIEKQNAYLKNLKALDNIRNTQAGHILIDYRMHVIWVILII